MLKQIFDKGSDVDIRADFADPSNANAPLDPTSLDLVVRAPDGTVTTSHLGDITKESAGHYLFRLRLAQEGTYNWRWEASTPTKSVTLPGSCDSRREVEF